MSKLVKFFQTKKASALAFWRRKDTDAEKKFNWASYNFPHALLEDHVRIALDFFLAARNSELPKEQQALVNINPVYLEQDRCESVTVSDIRTNNDREIRCSVFFQSREEQGAPPFEVELCKFMDEKWKVVGFAYPDLRGKAFYAAFESTHWFDIREKFDYESC